MMCQPVNACKSKTTHISSILPEGLILNLLSHLSPLPGSQHHSGEWENLSMVRIIASLVSCCLHLTCLDLIRLATARTMSRSVKGVLKPSRYSTKDASSTAKRFSQPIAERVNQGSALANRRDSFCSFIWHAVEKGRYHLHWYTTWTRKQSETTYLATAWRKSHRLG